MIANRIQEEAFGTVDPATVKLLDGLASRTSRPEHYLKIGSVLARDYRGRRHTVTVERDGYVCEGQPYSSLSAIARAITGTAWSAPRTGTWFASRGRWRVFRAGGYGEGRARERPLSGRRNRAASRGSSPAGRVRCRQPGKIAQLA
jgi:Protein of unknown function (DUF2924)